MYFGEALRFSWQALRANKFRSFLTALGLVIGNASVILVVTISITSRDYILDQIRGIGSNLIYAQYSAGTNTSTKADADFIKFADVDAVRQAVRLAHRRRHRRHDQLRPPAASTARNRMWRSSASDEYYPKSATWYCFPAVSWMRAMCNARQHVVMLTEKLAQRLYGSRQAAGRAGASSCTICSLP